MFAVSDDHTFTQVAKRSVDTGLFYSGGFGQGIGDIGSLVTGIGGPAEFVPGRVADAVKRAVEGTGFGLGPHVIIAILGRRLDTEDV